MLNAEVERKGARSGLNRRAPVLEKPITREGRSGSPKGFQIAKQVRTKHGTSGGGAGGLVMVDSVRVEEPKRIDDSDLTGYHLRHGTVGKRPGFSY